MRHIVTEGIILSRTNFGEADRIITVLTPDNGKIRLIAKGVRKIKSKLAGGIELFSISHISYIQGKGDISTLVSTRLQKHFGRIVEDINRTLFGYQVLKIINRVTEDNTDQDYFELVARTLSGLNKLDLNQQAIELWLYAQLLKLAGHTPNLKTDTAGNRLELDKKYKFNIDKMAFSTAPQGSFVSNHIKLLRLAISLDSPESLNQVNDLGVVLAKCLELTRSMLSQFVRL